jgi:excisionase family DNA binding protein
MDYFTVQEFAKKLKVHPSTVRRDIKKGKIYAFRSSSGLKSGYRIAESELERLHIQSMCENKGNN